MKLVPYALGIIGATLVQYLVINFMGAKHRKMFNQDFMDLNCGDKFKKEKKKAPKGGYPDCGNGLHSLKLNYGQWFDFNLA